ncbi:MAG TPA: hypothetical protein VN653_00050 [Anaerolineales bacterium]|nr:hypothetical protein [Anaerolineales bacterium]
MMEQISENSLDTKVKVKSGPANAWAPAGQPIRRDESNPSRLAEYVPVNGSQQSLGQIRACRISKRSFQQAQDRLKRANRDLGETAAFMVALITTVTAIEAVINVADGRIHIAPEYLKMAFDLYIALLMFILIAGALRSWGAILRRSQAEREIDQARQGIFEFCPGDEWLKTEE